MPNSPQHADPVTRVGRNQACPCGSGQKYKRCHGRIDDSPVARPTPFHGAVPPHVLAAFHAKETEHQNFLSDHGAGKGIISSEVNGMRFVAAGKSLHFSSRWQNFHDFLNGYLAAKLGKEWGERQVQLPIDQQHPAVQWLTHLALSQQGAQPEPDGWYSTTVGAGNAWIRLAYDLYLIDHNAELQRKLVRRLRDPVSFQGARFEAAVAAMMLASGYELAFADERGPGKHPEFYGTHRETGFVLAVEAKSRQRPGIMGFQPGVQASPPQSCGIDRMLLAAVEKDTDKPLLVFIEVNSPAYGGEPAIKAIWQELQQSCSAVETRPWPKGFPCVGVVFYNDVAPWFLRQPLRERAANIWVTALWPNASRHALDFRPHMQRIVQGCMQRSNPPLTFPLAN